MYAQIIPLVKMPRRFAFFDYKIPENLNTKIKIGDLVLVPLRGRIVHGIVHDLTTKSEFKKLQVIQSVVISEFMIEDDVKRLEQIAKQIIQSPSTVFTSALQGITYTRSTQQTSGQTKSGSIDKNTADTIQNALHNKEATIETSFEGSIVTIRFAIKKSKNQILILCPRERDVKIISNFLPMPHARLHGHTSTAKRKWILENWRLGKLKILIGTKQSSLIPAQKIDSIIIFDSMSENHINYSRNPRYNAVSAVQLLSKQHNSNIVFCGSLQNIENQQIAVIQTQKKNATLIDLNDAREKTKIPLVSETLLNAISNTLQNNKTVLISYNCKGFAKRLQCKSCNYIPTCGMCGSQPHVRQDDLVCPVCNSEMWIPKTCPSCNKPTLNSRGIGNKKIATDLKKKFPNVTIGIIDKEHSELSNADIQIVTEHYFQSIYKPFPTKRFGLIVELSADKSLGADFESSLVTAYRLNRLIHLANWHKAKLLIQTWMPDIIQPMLNSESFIKSESELRSKYDLPPFADQFEFSKNLEKIPEELLERCIEQNEKLILTTNPSERDKILSQLNKLPDSVTILTKYSSYDSTNC